MTIDQLLKLAHAYSLVHFPQGVEVMRDDGGYVASILTKSKDKYIPLSGRNKTAEGALTDLKNYVHNKANEYVRSKQRDAESAASGVSEILGENA